MENLYNEKQKLRFLENCEYADNTKESIKVWFRGAARVENRLDTDLSMFNEPQVIDLLKSFNSRSRRTLYSICAFFSKYYNWCLTEDLADSSQFGDYYESVKELIPTIIPTELINNRFFSKYDMLEYVDKIQDKVNKFIAYAIYNGVKGDEFEELINLKIEDLDEDNKTVNLITGRVASVDDVFIYLMKQANNTERYMPNGENIDDTKYYERSLYIDNGYVVKQCSKSIFGKPITPTLINPRLAYIKVQSGNRFVSASTLYKNGLINYIKEKYEERGITLEKALLSKATNKMYAYDRDTEEYAAEFGSVMTARLLRKEIKDYLDNFK